MKTHASTPALPPPIICAPAPRFPRRPRRPAPWTGARPGRPLADPVLAPLQFPSAPPPVHTMRLPILLPLLLLPLAKAQFPFTAFGGFQNLFQPIQNALHPFMQGIQSMFGFGPKFVDDGTVAPVATGNDPLFPDDCGRDSDKGTGKLCFPDGLLCQNRE